MSSTSSMHINIFVRAVIAGLCAGILDILNMSLRSGEHPPLLWDYIFAALPALPFVIMLLWGMWEEKKFNDEYLRFVSAQNVSRATAGFLILGLFWGRAEKNMELPHVPLNYVLYAWLACFLVVALFQKIRER